MRWLHVSDIHFNPQQDGRSSAQLREKLPGYLKSLGVRVDAVFVTGDFRHALHQKDTDEVARESAEFVRKLANSAGLKNPSHIYIVPGNHDLERNKRDPGGSKLSKIRNEYDIDKGTFKEKDKKYLLERFSFFNRIIKHLQPIDPVWSDSLQPIHPYRYLDSHNLYLLHLNTAITCGDKNDRGNLVIGNHDLYLTLNQIKKEQRSGARIIALAHHGIECFSSRERKVIENLFDEYSVKLYLCGDAHEVWHRETGLTQEITMGCIKQGKDVQAVFSIVELRSDGSINFNAHSWDPSMAAWGRYSHFDEKVNHSQPQPSATTRVQVFGRDTMIDSIYKELMDPASRYDAVEVHGAPGIGKSTICRAVMQRIDPAKATEVKLAGQTSKPEALTTILLAFGIKYPEQIEKQIEDLYHNYPNHTIYLDNLEEPLKDASFKDWFINFTKYSGWNILYSSRTIISNSRIQHKSVGRLDMQYAKEMFLSLWDSKLSDNEQRQLEKLLDMLDCHPLSITLVAAQKVPLPVVGELLKAARKNLTGMKIEDEEGPHRSLLTTVRMSYETVSGNREALTIWGILSLLPSALSRKLFELMFSDDLGAYEKAVNDLIKNGLVEAKALQPDDKLVYSMLSPIKELAFRFDATNRQRAIDLLREAFIQIFENGDQFDRPDRADWHAFSLECLLPALSFLEKTLFDEDRNKRLVREMQNYFQYSAPVSLALLRTLAKQQGDARFSAFLNIYIGSLEHRLGQPEDAQRHYEQAEKLFRDEQNNLGLANVLRSIGDLEFMLGQFKDARQHFEQAEKLFRDEQDNLGLANVLTSIGDLECRLGQLEDARQHYGQAEKLYHNEQTNLGLANVLTSIGDLELRLRQLEDARQHYGQAEELYRDEQDNLGLANVLRSIGDLECRLEQLEDARQHYAQAEKLYRDEQNNLGLANVLRSIGNLECGQQNYAHSIHLYEQALLFYDKEQEPMGKSYVLGELCRVHALMGNKDESLQWLKKTTDFLDQMPEQIPEQAHAYVTGCCNEASDLLGLAPSS